MNELITTALDRFDQAQDAYSKQRQDARDDLAFVAGNQWLDEAQQDDFRLTVPLLGPFLRQITAEAREANPSIRVVATSNQDVDLASVYEGLIRHLEQKCDAQSAYQTAMWYAAAGGEGYLLLDSEYCSADSFDQDLVIKAASNPELVFLDPLHELLDGCDAEWGFVISDMSHEAYQRQFPNSDLAQKLGTIGFDRLGLPNDWLSKHSVRVARYWVKERTTKTIYLCLDPVTNTQFTTDEKPDDTKVVLKTRQAEDITVKGYLINATEVLDETTWPSKYLPIIKVTGETFYVGGQKFQSGAIRHAKDAQRQYNYFASRQTELIDLAPKNSFVGATGQFANNPEKWANANRVNYGFLDYTPTALNGQPVPPPQRVNGVDVAALSAIQQARAVAFEDMKNIFGLQDASIGRPGNEISGVAIEARNSASRRSTYAYFDNLLVSLRCLGRQLIELIPAFYDTERTIRIVKPDTTEQLVSINSATNNFKYDLTKGTYNVVVTTGPAFASKRQEGLSALQGLMQALPETGAVIGDIVAGLVDSPVAQLAAKRIKATIPPNVLAATGEDDDQDLAPMEQVQKLQQALAKSEQELQTLTLQKQELEVKLTAVESDTALKLTQSDLQHQVEMAKLDHQSRLADIEAALKEKQLELAERELEVKEKQLQLMAAGKLHDVMKGDVDIPAQHNVG